MGYEEMKKEMEALIKGDKMKEIEKEKPLSLDDIQLNWGISQFSLFI